MPGGDGTGPYGQGPGTGRGLGRGKGKGRGNRPGTGPGGECVCPSCGQRVPHQAGTPCTEVKCLKCGAAMLRG